MKYEASILDFVNSIKMFDTSALKKGTSGWQKYQKEFYQGNGDSWKAKII